MKERQEKMKHFMNGFEGKMTNAFTPFKADGEEIPKNAHDSKDNITDFVKDRPFEKKRRSLKVIVDSCDGDKVRVSLPLNIGRLLLSKGSKLSGKWSENLNDETLDAVLEMIDQGHMGELIHVKSAEGDNVIIKVE